MKDQTTTFLSSLNEMKVEEVRTHFLDLFTQALAIENEEVEQYCAGYRENQHEQALEYSHHGSGQ